MRASCLTPGFCIALALGPFAPTIADAALPGAAGQRPALAGLVRVAALDDIADPGQRRRVGFYADKVLAAMARLAEDDARVTAEGGEPDAAVVDGFRTALLRFVEAALAAGVAEGDIAAILVDAYDARYDGPTPTQLLDSNQKLEATSLVETSLGFRRFGDAVPQPKVDYLSAIAVEGSKVRTERLSRLDPNGEVPDEAVAAATAQPIEGEDLNAVEDVVEDVDPVIASIRERIVETDGERTITIQRGDTLGLISRAIYGDALLYRNIYAYNRDVMNNPDSLRVGIEIRLPQL